MKHLAIHREKLAKRGIKLANRIAIGATAGDRIRDFGELRIILDELCIWQIAETKFMIALEIAAQNYEVGSDEWYNEICEPLLRYGRIFSRAFKVFLQ